jgi:uncharacterized protein YjeT (DUF2065 family)
MSDLAVGFGLVLVIEGLIWALAPTIGIKLLATAASSPPEALRLSGMAAIAAGALVVWLVRG